MKTADASQGGVQGAAEREDVSAHGEVGRTAQNLYA